MIFVKRRKDAAISGVAVITALVIINPLGLGRTPDSVKVQTDGGKNTQDSSQTQTDGGKNTQDSSQIQTVKANPDDLVAVAGVNVYLGYINTKSQWVIAPQYVGASPFSDNFAVVAKPLNDRNTVIFQIIDKTGAVVAELPDGVEPAGLYHEGYTGLNGGPTIPYFRCHENIISEGMFLIRNSDYEKTGEKYGFANVKGEVVVSPQYVYAENFSNGLAVVGKTNGSYFYIDKQGKVVIPGPFTTAESFSEGLAGVIWGNSVNHENSKNALPEKESGFIDTTGKIVIRGQGTRVNSKIFGEELHKLYWTGISLDPEFDSALIRINYGLWASTFFDGVALVNYEIYTETEFKVAVACIDKSGKIVWIDNKLDKDGYGQYKLWTYSYYNSGVAFLWDENRKNILIDQTGKIIPVAIKNWRPCSKFSEGLAIVMDDDQSGLLKSYIDTSGKVIATGYKEAYPFINGYAFVETDVGSELYVTEDFNAIIDKTGAVFIQGTDKMNPQAPFTK